MDDKIDEILDLLKSQNEMIKDIHDYVKEVTSEKYIGESRMTNFSINLAADILTEAISPKIKGLRQGREDKIHGFEFTSQTRDKIRRLITDTSGLRSHRFLYDKEDDKKQRSTENRLFKKYACRDWDGRGSTQWKSFPTQSPICRGNDGLPFNVDNLTIPYGKWRKESIKAYGNAIVPLIAVKIFEMINKIEGYEQQTTL